MEYAFRDDVFLVNLLTMMDARQLYEIYNNSIFGFTLVVKFHRMLDDPIVLKELYNREGLKYIKDDSFENFICHCDSYILFSNDSSTEYRIKRFKSIHNELYSYDFLIKHPHYRVKILLENAAKVKDFDFIDIILEDLNLQNSPYHILAVIKEIYPDRISKYLNYFIHGQIRGSLIEKCVANLIYSGRVIPEFLREFLELNPPIGIGAIQYMIGYQQWMRKCQHFLMCGLDL